jgi:hypothetical protein
MAEPVAKVPDPWERYKDGRIWKFTEDEWKVMPGHRPTSGVNGELVGDRQMQWHVDGHVYLRFFDEQVFQDHPNDWPQYLAGWVEPKDAPWPLSPTG